MFQKSTENRLRPTNDLVEAENQLLHYYLELQNSQQFLIDFNIHPNSVHLGGIIIGSSKTRVKGDYDESTRVRLYETAVRSRNLLYKPAGIRLMLWDDILKCAKQMREIHTDP